MTEDTRSDEERTEDTTEEREEARGGTPAEPYRRLEFSSKEEEEEHYNKVFKDRDKRIREKIREEEKANAERDAKRKAAKEAEDYKALYEEEEKKAQNLQARVDELEPIKGERDASQERIDALEKRLKGMLKPQLERVPEIYREFVEAKSVEEQAEWFEKNSEKLEPANGRPAGSRATGPAARGVKGDEKEAERARESQRSVSRI
jgi:hypothetical protein